MKCVMPGARLAAAALIGVAFVRSSPAQAPDTSRHGPVLARTDAAIIGVAALTSGVLLGWDGAIARHMQGSPLRDDAFVRTVMDGASTYGDPGTIVLGAGVWLSGRLAHDATRERIGMRAVEAIVASGIVGGALKGLTGRARPDTSGNPRDFVLGRGIGNREAFQSFPSGHATAAWAFASAVDAEWLRLRPSRPRWVPAALYAAATLTAASRVYRNRHWASDVVMGGAIGFVSGRAVVRWHRDPP
ncbi:MAG TPA: phosphatase PAP2 family protein [Gemmatimonadaceae bacterium]|nr:phosphatase PAP2 family protein [Gemmatimonadaceae bacterium]